MPLNSPPKNGQTLGKSRKNHPPGALGCFAPPAPKLGVATVTSVDHCSAMVEALGDETFPGAPAPLEQGEQLGDVELLGWGCWV